MSKDEFSIARERRDAGRYLLLQTAALLKRFKQANGRAALNWEELDEWAPAGSASINPYEILTGEEIQATSR